MMTRALIVLLLTGCYATHPPGERPATFTELNFGEQVPTGLLIEAADALEPCIGRPYDLDGWTAWVVADSYQCLNGDCFSCPLDTKPMCPPPPPGYTEETAPCECGGSTHFATKQIALAPDLGSLRHEVRHAGWLLYDPQHREPEWRLCP